MILQQAANPRLTHVPPGGGESIDVLGDIATFKISSEATGGRLVIAEIVTPPGGGPQGLHAHPTEEVFYVLDGEFEIQGLDVDGKPFTERAGAGSVIHIPSEAVHTFRNTGTTPGRLLITYTSPELEQMARALADLGTRPPIEPEAVRAILAEHGIRFVEPSS